MRKQLLTLIFLGGALAAPASSAPVVFSASGATAADILSTVEDYRNALGTLNGNLPENFAGGRREINWDGVPDASSEPNPFPGDFFNGNTPGRARGSVFSTPGANLLVSIPGTDDDYIAFSPQKVFEAEGSFEIDHEFFSPKNNTLRALTNGLGVIFLDIDEENTASLEFFNIGGASIGKYFAPAAPGDFTFSFLGVQFDTAEVARVRVTVGTPTDDAAVDDFIYGEPSAVPEPSAYLMAAGGLAALYIKRRRMFAR